LVINEYIWIKDEACGLFQGSFSTLAWKTLKTETLVCRPDEVRTVAGAFNASQHVAVVQVEETWCDEKYRELGQHISFASIKRQPEALCE
jgi:hypothetical protein